MRGGGHFYCSGICYSSKKPDFTCNNVDDCICACGHAAKYGGAHQCIAINKSSKSFLEYNDLEIENKFILLCYEKHCALQIKTEDYITEESREIIYGFGISNRENLYIEPFELNPK